MFYFLPDEEPQNAETPKEDIAKLVRLYVDDGKIADAVVIARESAVISREFNAMRFVKNPTYLILLGI